MSCKHLCAHSDTFDVLSPNNQDRLNQHNHESKVVSALHELWIATNHDTHKRTVGQMNDERLEKRSANFAREGSR